MDVLRIVLICIISFSIINTVPIFISMFRSDNTYKGKELEEYTLEDCINLYEHKGQHAIIEKGKLIGFD